MTGAKYLSRTVARNRDFLGILAVLLILVVIYRQFDPYLFSEISLVMLSVQLLPLILAAMGQTTIMLTGGIDLSLGAVLSLAMAVFAINTGDTIGSTVFAAVLGVLAAVGAGLINGALVTFAGLPPIIVTLAASFLWSGVTLIVLPKPGGAVPANLMSWYNSSLWILPVPLLLGVLFAVLWKLTSKTRFGLSLYAVGGNENGAFANAIPTHRVKLGAYGLAGVFVGFAGIALAIQSGSGDPNIGGTFTLNSIAAAVLGGVAFLGGEGRMRGAIVGALVIGLLGNLLLFTGISPFYQLVVQGLILVIAIAIKNFSLIRGRGASL